MDSKASQEHGRRDFITSIGRLDRRLVHIELRKTLIVERCPRERYRQPGLYRGLPTPPITPRDPPPTYHLSSCICPVITIDAIIPARSHPHNTKYLAVKSFLRICNSDQITRLRPIPRTPVSNSIYVFSESPYRAAIEAGPAWLKFGSPSAVMLALISCPAITASGTSTKDRLSC